MKVTQSDRNLSCVKFCTVLSETFSLNQMLQKFSSSISSYFVKISLPNIIHYEIYARRFKKHILHRYQKRMINLKQYSFLDMNVFNRIQLHHDILPNAFHRIKLLSFLISY